MTLEKQLLLLLFVLSNIKSCEFVKHFIGDTFTVFKVLPSPDYVDVEIGVRCVLLTLK